MRERWLSIAAILLLVTGACGLRESAGKPPPSDPPDDLTEKWQPPRCGLPFADPVPIHAFGVFGGSGVNLSACGHLFVRDLGLAGPDLRKAVDLDVDIRDHTAFSPTGEWFSIGRWSDSLEQLRLFDLAIGQTTTYEALESSGFLVLTDRRRSLPWICDASGLRLVVDGTEQPIPVEGIDCRSVRTAPAAPRFAFVGSDGLLAVYDLDSDRTWSTGYVAAGETTTRRRRDLYGFSPDGRVLFHQERWFHASGYDGPGLLAMFDVDEERLIDRYPAIPVTSPISVPNTGHEFIWRIPGLSYGLDSALQGHRLGNWIYLALGPDRALVMKDQQVKQLRLSTGELVDTLDREYANSWRNWKNCFEEAIFVELLTRGTEGSCAEAKFSSGARAMATAWECGTALPCYSAPCDCVGSRLTLWTEAHGVVLRAEGDNLVPFWVGDDGALVAGGRFGETEEARFWDANGELVASWPWPASRDFTRYVDVIESSGFLFLGSSSRAAEGAYGAIALDRATGAVFPLSDSPVRLKASDEEGKRIVFSVIADGKRVLWGGSPSK